MSATAALARLAIAPFGDGLPARTLAEARRSFLNWLGCAIGASGHATVETALGAILPFAGPGQAAVLGRRERVDALHAALLNGMSGHTFDFDDTHLRTIIHPAGPVAAAILALGETRRTSGRELLEALVIGVEVECRIGNAVYPDHYDRGWHITGTAGVFGAAAAVSKLLDLSEQQMIWA